MDIDARVEAWASLQLIPGLTPAALVKLLQALGGPVEILASSRANLAALVGSDIATAVKLGPDPAQLAHALEWLRLDTHALITWDDADYPQSLLTIADPPPALYLSGRRDLLNRPAIAIVGSRNATPQGLDDAEAFGGALSAAGVTIISGLALGIDAAAHRGGLAGAGSTVAVVGTGSDRVYPARNRDLAHAIAASGALVSQFALGTPPLPGNFPRRNRVISGLARGVLVVEASLNSGSLITARFAVEQGRDVFAIPGSIHSPFSKGSHRLIKEGAKLVETAQDVLDELGALGELGAISGITRRVEKPVRPAPKGHAAKLLNALGREITSVDQLVERSGFSASVVSAVLLELELEGHVRRAPGGSFQRAG